MGLRYGRASSARTHLLGEVWKRALSLSFNTGSHHDESDRITLSPDLKLDLMPTEDIESTFTRHSRCAGEFLVWLQDALDTFFSGQGASVPCGDCKACCRAGYFIPVRDQECSTIAAIPARLLVRSPGAPGHGGSLISTTRRGNCALLINGACSIYRQRPQACRDYDCRIFAAAGLESGHGEIDRQVAQWRFDYNGEESKQVHAAVRAAARFVVEHAQAFPGRRVPQRSADIALVALKSYRVFLDRTKQGGAPEDIAEAIVSTCRAFDATGGLAFSMPHSV